MIEVKQQSFGDEEYTTAEFTTENDGDDVVVIYGGAYLDGGLVGVCCDEADGLITEFLMTRAELTAFIGILQEALDQMPE